MLIVRLKIMLRLSFLKISGVVYSVKLIKNSLHNKTLYYFHGIISICHYQKLSTTWLTLISSVSKISFSTFKTFPCFYNVLILWVNSMKFIILSLIYIWKKNAPNCIHDKWKWISYLLQYRIFQRCSQWVQSISEVLVQISHPCNVVLIIVCF